jgi:guanine deaminase
MINVIIIILIIMTDFLKEYYDLKDKKFMNMAINESNTSLGGPFGAIIVKDGSVISKGNNMVTVNNDPTAHAEVVAIRNACNNLNTFSLEKCTLYTSCEPCPMCLSAIYWARIEKVFYANTRDDAASINFDDKEIYDEIGKDISDRKIKMIHISDTNAYNTFENWKNNCNKVHY